MGQRARVVSSGCHQQRSSGCGIAPALNPPIERVRPECRAKGAAAGMCALKMVADAIRMACGERIAFCINYRQSGDL